MQIEQKPVAFEPVTIILESQDELNLFVGLVQDTLDNAPSFSTADKAAKKLKPLLVEVGAMAA